MFYVYEWYNTQTNEIFYVGKGTNRRYKVRKHNRLFNEFIKRFPCESRIVAEFENEKDAFSYEYRHIQELQGEGQCVCNLKIGGSGGSVEGWTTEKRMKYSKNNVMKSETQRVRMSQNNPMKNTEVARKVAEQVIRAVFINGTYYPSVKEAANKLGVWDISVSRWCKRGYNTTGEPCRYADEEQKEYYFQHSSSKAVWVDNMKYPSVKEAAKSLGVWSETIIRSIKANKLCKGHKCRYDNQQPSREKSDNSIAEGSTTNE